MKKDPKIYLKHILDSISEIKKYIKGVSEDQFGQSTQIQDAVIRRLEIIGEASKNIPDEIKTKYNFIPWRKVTGSRDILIHDYFEVDLKSVWETVVNDLPSLEKDIQKILEEL